MNRLLVWPALGLLFLAGCVAPSTDSLTEPNRPLAEGEMLTIWRYSRYASAKEVLDTSATYASQMEAMMEPLFQQLIPQVMADAKEGRLRVYEDDSELSLLNETPIPDLESRLAAAYGAGFDQTGPLQVVMHVIQRRGQKTKGFAAENREMMLIVSDPEGRQPERYMGSVYMADLIQLGYEIETDNGRQPLEDYLVRSADYAYPIYYETADIKAGLRTLEAAFFTRQKMLDGEWSQIEWLALDPNMTDFSVVSMPQEKMAAMQGTYTFAAGQDAYLTNAGEAVTLTLEVGSDKTYLYGSWSSLSPYQAYIFFPKEDGRWFTTDGAILSLTPNEAGQMEASLMLSEEKELKGIRM